jgi:hypothetical protein
MDVTNLVTAAGGVLTIAVTIGAGARYVGKRLNRVSDQWDDFKGDWYGQPARPGRPPQPGVMERLGKIEAAIADTSLVNRMGELERRMDAELHSRGADRIG